MAQERGKALIAMSGGVETGKAAICAEDIAKGVFVPVGSLLQREPMKAVI